MSLQNPTRSYLNENFTKPQLQKHCRELGLTKIWVNKEQLIDMIMEKHQLSLNDTSGEETQEGVSNSSLQGIISDIVEIKEKLAVKDVEIDDLYGKLNVANVTIGRLQDRVSSLEDQIRRGQHSNSDEQPTVNHQPPIRTTLLLGDTNLSHITSKDLSKECSVRTIKDANIDLLRSWVNEQLDWNPSRCILYGGIFDIQENVTPSQFIDNLSMLVSDLKGKNPEMDIHVCQLVPTLQSDELQAMINEFNDELMKWSHTL